MGAAAGEAEERWARVVALAACALSAALGSVRLGSKSLTMDESASVLFARLPWSEFLELQLGHEVNMGTHYVLLRPIVAVSTSELALRLPSLVLGVAAVAATFGLGRRLFGPREGATAAGLLAISQLALQYAQTARGYSLVMALVVVSTWAIVLAAERRSTGWWAVWLLASVLAWYTHPYSVLVTGSQLLVLWARGPRERRALIVPAVGAAPLLVLLALMRGRADRGLEWVPPVRPVDIGRFVTAMSGRWWPLVLVIVPLAGTGAVVCFQRLLAQRDWHAGLVVAWFVAPVVAVFAVSVAVTPIYVLRYMIVVLPPFLLLAAVGFWRLPALGPRVAVGVLVVGLSIVPLGRWLLGEGREDFRAATQLVLEQARPGDAVMFPRPSHRVPVEHYVGRLGEPAAPSIAPPVPWGDLIGLGRVVFTDDTLAAPGDHASYDRIWVLQRDEPGLTTPGSYEVDLGDLGFELVERHRFLEVTVELHRAR